MQDLGNTQFFQVEVEPETGVKVILSAVFGLQEQLLILYPIFAMLCTVLNWSSFTAISFILIASGVGFTTAITNPLTIGTASLAAGVSVVDGLWYRCIIFCVMYVITSLFLIYLAKKDEKKSIKKFDEQEFFMISKEEHIEDIKKANEVGEYVCMTIGLGRGDLQIKKIITDKLGRVIDTDETYVFRITGEPFDGSGYIDMYVTIHGTGTETIYNLPYADYKVLEVGNTEWRYDVTVDGKASINNETKTPIITVTNRLVDSRWLTAESSINNIFTKS